MKRTAYECNGQTNATPTQKGEATPLAATPAAHYGSSVSMADALKVKDERVHSPPIDEGFVQSLAAAVASTGGNPAIRAAAEERVRNHHGHIFDAHNIELREKCVHLATPVAADNAGIARQQKDLTQVNEETARYHERTESGSPCTKADKAKLIAFACMSALLLVIESNSTAQVLMASGVPGFESLIRCYLFSAIPIGLAMLVKLPSTFFDSRGLLMAYIWFVFSAALCFSVYWVVLFANMFPGMTMSTADVINSIGQSRPAESTPRLIVVAILAEALTAGVLWLAMEVIADKHEPASREDSPAFLKTQTDLDHWQRRQFEQEEIAASLHAKVKAIDHARATFIEQAVGRFQFALLEYGSQPESAVKTESNQTPNPKRKMKRPHSLLVLLAGLFCLSTHAATPARYVIGLSPRYSPADRDTVLKELLLFALEGAAPGDSIVVYDALRLQPVTQFKVPTGSLFEKNARARVARLQPELATIKSFLQDGRAFVPDLAGALQVPGFLTLAGTQLRRPEERMHIILLGSPHHVSVEEPAFNTREAFPSDAHLSAGLEKSPFSVVGRHQDLAGVTVHYGYFRDAFVNDLHKERMARFYSLFIGGQGGACGTFAPNIGLAFQRARGGVSDPFLRVEVDPNDTKLEMRHVAPRVTPGWFPPTNAVTAPRTHPQLVPQPATQASPQPATTPAATAPVAPAAFPVAPTNGITGIGIMWAAPGCDFDLWVKPSPSAPDLYFAKTQTPEGRYFHDYRDRNQGVDYEYVELKNKVDLRQVRAYVNFYEGRSDSPTGVVILHHGGRTYSGVFTLQAKAGNRAADLGRRNESPHWVEIDLMQLLGSGQQLNEPR